ncbi:hypothetical protein M0805_003610 [Coniferiporia weirii]|nr:hypothetical protein M0805_003610 [Coniferiporia weirii]
MSQDELDTCRICSAPGEQDAPLFHPCKCSGTIRYIHQDCLTTWLAHSKKKTCDVCKYQYSFTKVYSPYMPKQIPFILFLRKFAQQVFWACVMALRGVMVATIWLAFLPYVTVWTWRFYFIMGENIAWWINDRPLVEERNGTDVSNRTLIGLATSYPVWRALSSDIFTGQIIASLIVLVFLGIFLLREWIMQNARPGVFEENEFAEEDVQEEAEVVLQPPAQPQLQPHDDLHPPPVTEAQLVEPIEAVASGSFSNRRDPLAARSPEGNASNASSETMEVSDMPAVDFPESPRYTRRLRVAEDKYKERGLRAPRSRTWPRTQDRSTSTSYAKGKGKARVLTPDTPTRESSEEVSLSSGLGEYHKDFEFTFSVSRPASPGMDDASSSRSDPSTMFSLRLPPSGEELLQFNSTRLPFPLNSDFVPSEFIDIPSGPRRPPLPSSSLSSPEGLSSSDYAAIGEHVSPLISPAYVPTVPETSDQPLASPGLATYRAPEELEAGPSRSGQTGYFDDDDGQSTDRAPAPSSAGATVAESAFHEDLTEFFRDESGESDGEEWDEPLEGEPVLLREENVARHNRFNAVEDMNPPRAAGERQAIGALEDPDAINDDDVDGALEEAIGMRGALTTVFQNAALMIFVLDTTIGIAVWLPFTIGKTTALLSLEPVRILQILQWPIRAIRYITDPVVDSIASLLITTILPVLKRFFKFATEPFATSMVSSGGLMRLGTESKTLFDTGYLKVLISRGPDAQSNAVARGISHVSNSPVAHLLEPYFACLGRQVRLNATALKYTWINLANGDASVNRFFAITLGYALAGLLVAIYLNVLNVGSVQSAGRAIRNAIRQQLIVLKVAVFIVIELAVFPLGCGMMLDFCTLQMFPNATLRSRLTFFAYAPVTATFYHWMIGTMFMYQFAILLSGCRKILRSGALWFIKDPQDQNFHPIRDILDRPTLIQLRKLAVSAALYSVVVALGMGGLVSCLRLWGRVLLPLRWKLREPFSDIPVDLLFLHIVMPSTFKYFRPRKFAYALAYRYWRWAARQLRLTSYMFGGLHHEEMHPSKIAFSWLSPFSGPKQPDGPSEAHRNDQFDGGYRRVPAQDNIALPREIRATVAVDEHGDPLDEAGRRLMDIQNSEAEKARRDISADYTLVYLPPHFRERVILFILSLWLVGSSLFVTALAIPTLLGRGAFRLTLDREVHDGYSIVVGFYLLWGCYYLVRLLDRMNKRRQRNARGEARSKWVVYIFKRGVLWAGNFAWVAFWLGFVIPTLIALVMEVYLVHPLRLMVKPSLTLNIRIFDSWALGLLWTKIVLSTLRLRRETRIDTAFKEMKRNGWKRLDAVAVTLDIIAPVVAGLLGMLFLPVVVILGLRQLLPTKINPDILFLYIYPSIFICAAFARMYSVLQVLCGSWAQQIRDTEFLVEMQLKNLEPNPPVPELADTSQSSSSKASPADTPSPE